jgi:hypothetical protein
MKGALRELFNSSRRSRAAQPRTATSPSCASTQALCRCDAASPLGSEGSNGRRARSSLVSPACLRPNDRSRKCSVRWVWVGPESRPSPLHSASIPALRCDRGVVPAVNRRFVRERTDVLAGGAAFSIASRHFAPRDRCLSPRARHFASSDRKIAREQSPCRRHAATCFRNRLQLTELASALSNARARERWAESPPTRRPSLTNVGSAPGHGARARPHALRCASHGRRSVRTGAPGARHFETGVDEVEIFRRHAERRMFTSGQPLPRDGNAGARGSNARRRRRAIGRSGAGGEPRLRHDGPRSCVRSVPHVLPQPRSCRRTTRRRQ